MYYNLYIKPETLSILGGVQGTCSQGAQTQGDPTGEPSLWQRFCSNAKKAIDKIGQALDFINEKILPIVSTVTGFLKVWTVLRGAGNGRDAVCPA